MSKSLARIKGRRAFTSTAVVTGTSCSHKGNQYGVFSKNMYENENMYELTVLLNEALLSLNL